TSRVFALSSSLLRSTSASPSFFVCWTRGVMRLMSFSDFVPNILVIMLSIAFQRVSDNITGKRQQPFPARIQSYMVFRDLPTRRAGFRVAIIVPDCPQTPFWQGQLEKYRGTCRTGRF